MTYINPSLGPHDKVAGNNGIHGEACFYSGVQVNIRLKVEALAETRF